ncbi:hypothetical protein AVEN_36509-1 [Araneus ventricosus]|uniref:Uncharacterized protein n=1 Tax=Araneus ventricosus TaxID=182803 RepID=A0A4Y2H355_ARAVE|nr:hypothetical protein AVEN_36509-1 [Araneus ventricosus]
MKRRLRTVLDLLHPDLFENRKRKNEELLDQRLSKDKLRSFSPNDAVYIKNHSSGQLRFQGQLLKKRIHFPTELLLRMKLKGIQLFLRPLQRYRPAKTLQFSRVILQLKSKLLRRLLMNPIKVDLDEP